MLIRIPLRFSLSTLLALAGLLAQAPANADIVYLSRWSDAAIYPCSSSSPFSCGAPTRNSSTTFDPFNANLSVASIGSAVQSSSLLQGGISVNGNASSTGFNIAVSIFEVQFSLTTAMAFSFTGQTAFDPSTGGAEISFIGPNSTSVVSPTIQSCASPVCQFFNATGTLQAGTYTLRVQSLADISQNPSAASASANLTFSPVPLPAASWLLLSALGGLGAWRRAFRG